MGRVAVICTGAILASCDPVLEIEREGPPIDATPSPAALPMRPEAPMVAVPHSVASPAAVEGYDAALEAEPPPTPGSTIVELYLSRPQPTVDDLQERLEGMLAAMYLELEPSEVAAWAQQASTVDADPHGRASITEPRPGLVITYDAWFDDLSVVDVTRLAEDGGQLDAVPWAVASDAMDVLVTRGIVDTNLSYDEVSVSYVRSGLKGPDGTHEEWVDEVRFEANGRLDRVAILDAGVRIGITPELRVSSIRVNRIEIAPDPEPSPNPEPTFVEVSEAELRDSFADHVDGSTSANIESVLVSARRPAYMLEPSSPSSIVAPRYMIDYAITVGTSDEDRMGSRATMVFLSLTHAPPSVELELP